MGVQPAKVSNCRTVPLMGRDSAPCPAYQEARPPIVAGTDQVVPGFSLLDRELLIELYVQAGFTPMEAIQAATLVPARAMGMEKQS